MANRLEALHFLLRDAEGVATLAAVINGRADLQQTLILMCPAFAPRLAMNNMLNPYGPSSTSSMSFTSTPNPLSSPTHFMTPFSSGHLQGGALPPTPITAPSFASPMPVCPKCHHSYGPERMAVHLKVCGGNLDSRGIDPLRSPSLSSARLLSANATDQLNQESSSFTLDDPPPRPNNSKDEQTGVRTTLKDDQLVGGGRPLVAPSGSFPKDEKPVGGGSRRNSLTEMTPNRGAGAYAAKDDQPIGGVRGTGAYAAKDEQAIGASRRNVRDESTADEQAQQGSVNAFVAKEERPIGGGRGTGAYASKDDQPIGGRAGTGAYAAKDDQPIGGRAGTGAYAAKDDQPIGGRPGTGAYAAKDDQPIGASRRRSVKEEQPPFGQPETGAKDDQPIGGRAGTGAYAAKDDQPIGGRPGTGAYAAKDDQPIGGRPGTGAYAAKDDQPIGGRPGTGAYAAKDDQPIGPSRRRSVKEEQPPFVEEAQSIEVSKETPSNSRRGSYTDSGEAASVRGEDPEEEVFENGAEDDESVFVRAGGGAYLAKDEKPVGRGNLDGQDAAPEQEEARVACPKCNRQFASSRIDKHSKVCKADSSAPVVEEKPEPKAAPKPPPKRSEPPPDGVKKKSFAERQMEALEAKFQSCAKCGRKFAPDRIGKHESVCKGNSVKRSEDDATEEPVKEDAVELGTPRARESASSTKKVAPAPPPEGKRKTFAERQMEAMEAKFQACAKCGRKFAPDRVEKHESVCKGKEKQLTRASASDEPEDDGPLPTAQARDPIVPKKVQLPTGFKAMQR